MSKRRRSGRVVPVKPTIDRAAAAVLLRAAHVP